MSRTACLIFNPVAGQGDSEKDLNTIKTLLSSFYDLYRSAVNNRAAKHKNISYLRSRKARISTEPPQKVVVDGEVVGTTPIEVECLPQSLTIHGQQSSSS